MSIRKSHAFLAIVAVAGVVAIAFVPDRVAVANWILAALAGVCWMFVGAYAIGSDWRATAPGRAVMRMVFCLALICTHGVVTVVSDYGYPGREVIRPLLLFGVLLAVLDLLLTLLRIQRARNRGDS